MPHKKNPDVFELTRAKCNRLQALPYEITLVTNNLPSGYFRDMQLVKESFLPAFDELIAVLDMVGAMVSGIKVNDKAAADPRYDLMYSVEEVNRQVLAGVPFRDAYRQVGLAIERGEFVPDREIRHTHEGSAGNLCTEEIRALYGDAVARFGFESWHRAVDHLLERR